MILWVGIEVDFSQVDRVGLRCGEVPYPKTMFAGGFVSVGAEGLRTDIALILLDLHR